MTGRLAAVIGSAAPSVRTAGAVEHVCQKARALKPGFEADIIDLHKMVLPFCDGRKATEVESVADMVRVVSAASAVLLATPIYRGCFTGALKNLLDWLPVEALEGKPVGLIASGATAHHYLMIDCTLRPMLSWFNAVPLPGSVYLMREDMSGEGVPTPKTAERLDALAQALVSYKPQPAGPPPLVRQLWC
jgi:NAD(P)H-dependent FMN reductase